MTVAAPRDELEELFDELGELHELRAGVQTKVLAHDIKRAMKSKSISASQMARRMRTSREAVYRLLDPTRTGDARFAPANANDVQNAFGRSAPRRRQVWPRSCDR